MPYFFSAVRGPHRRVARNAPTLLRGGAIATLVGASLATGDRIFATGSGGVSIRKILLVQRTPGGGGVEKRWGWKTSRMTPLPKRGFGPPLVRYVFHPPQMSVLCFSCTRIHDRVDQKLFWRGPKIFGRARSLVRFPPPIRFAPPHVTAQLVSIKVFCSQFRGRKWRRQFYGHLEKLRPFCRKSHVHKIPRFRGGGYFGFFGGGGGGVPILFLWARGFF